MPGVSLLVLVALMQLFVSILANRRRYKLGKHTIVITHTATVFMHGGPSAWTSG